MAQDIKVRNIQVEEIQSTAPQPISGDDAILVNAKLRYTEGFTLDDDYDLVYKSYLDSIIAGGTENLTTSELDQAALDLAYPDAPNRYEVVCPSITDNPLIYKKTSTGWYSIPLGTVS